MRREIFLLFFILQTIFVLAQPKTEAATDTIKLSHQNILPTLTIDRPDQTDSPYVIPVGFFQIETGIQHVWDKYQTDGVNYNFRSVAYPNLLLRYGLFKRVELRLEQNYSVDKIELDFVTREIEKNVGWHPTLLAAKIMLFEQKGWRPNIAILAKLLTPYHSRKGIRFNYKYTPGLVGAFSHSMADRFVLDGSVGGTLDQITGKINITYSLSQAIGFNQKLSMFIEIFGYKPAVEKVQYAIDTGLLYMLLPHLQLDIYASKSISYNAVDVFAGAGVGIRLPR